MADLNEGVKERIKSGLKKHVSDLPNIQALIKAVDDGRIDNIRKWLFEQLTSPQANFESLSSAINDIDDDFRKILFDSEQAVSADYLRALSQVPTALKAMAEELDNIKFRQLQDKRGKKGFQHFHNGLKDKKFNHKGTGWAIVNGLLTVEPTHLTNPDTAREINQYLDEKQTGKPWYTPTTEQPEGFAPRGDLNIQAKTLGKFGPNAAVDPIFYVQKSDGKFQKPDGKWSVLTIKRFDGSLAFPGGMQEAKVKETCVEELLEECFSGGLFISGSQTAAQLDSARIPPEAVKETMQQAMLKFLEGNDPTKAAKQIWQARDILMGIGDASTPSEMVNKIVQAIRDSPRIDEGKKGSMIALARCAVYEKCLPERFAKFKSFVESKMQEGEQVINRTDPRNTNTAWMVTTPVMVALNQDDFDNFFLDELGLTLTEGDDAAAVQFRDVDEFAHSITGENGSEVYSSHATIAMNAFSTMVESGMLSASPQLLGQLESVAQSNGLTQHLPKACLQPVPPTSSAVAPR